MWFLFTGAGEGEGEEKGGGVREYFNLQDVCFA